MRPRSALLPLLVLTAFVIASGAWPSAASDRPYARLLVKAESDLVLLVDGEPIGEFSKGDVWRLDVDRGEHLLQAAAVGSEGVTWERVFLTDEPKQYFVRIDLGDPHFRVGPPAAASAAPAKPAPAPRTPQAPAEPLPRDPGEGMVYDEVSDLIWTASDNGEMINWMEAREYCENLALGGYDDWRLPTYDELKALYDDDVDGKWRIRHGIELSECCIWSTQRPTSQSATTLNFMGGRAIAMDIDGSEFERVLCARGHAPREDDGAEGEDAD